MTKITLCTALCHNDSTRENTEPSVDSTQVYSTFWWSDHPTVFYRHAGQNTRKPLVLRVVEQLPSRLLPIWPMTYNPWTPTCRPIGLLALLPLLISFTRQPRGNKNVVCSWRGCLRDPVVDQLCAIDCCIDLSGYYVERCLRCHRKFARLHSSLHPGPLSPVRGGLLLASLCITLSQYCVL